MEESSLSLLNVKALNKSFGGIQVLFDVEFELRSGEIHCLIGENGAGKSTLVKVLTGVYNDYKGEILIDGQACTITSPVVSKKYGIHTIQQSKDLVLEMDAVSNIFLGNQIKSKLLLNWKEMRKRAKDLLDNFNVSINLDVPVGQLRASEQGIIAICKALSSEGKILLVDEASAPLDNSERMLLYNILNKLKEQGKGIVYISHHLEELYKVGDRVTILRNGRNVWTKNVCDTKQQDLIDGMTGNRKLYLRDEKRNNIIFDRTAAPVLKFDDVSTKHLDHISFEAAKGEVIGFAGLEGSNKHYIAEAVYGLDKLRNGQILINGRQIHHKYVVDAIRNQIGYVPNDRKGQGLILCRDIIENVAIVAVNKSRNILVSNAWMRKAAAMETRRLSIKCASNKQLLQYLSGGNQQKVLLAKWLQAQVDILMLNEPTEGIDVGARADLYKALHEVADSGKTLLVFGSDLAELITLCDRIFTMSHGRVINCYDASTVETRTLLSDILSKHSGGGEDVG